ncbi:MULTISPECIES: ABC transporter substrate-binding protein [unclassified Oceanobacter]|jgi:branched-chain amino acid transport system substrate-binding protein|uniref:ABC transporter substrate-binding protein n=1 Tax=unclassified Oceanobacter TaxID=2620260 RepID=UPI0026E43805|nr:MULTISPECIES: ABC transporter substrate-binding protein [unclassified Oceanobacter]MDO6681401.1 ABC transporter substrate-binding protein [Oceanobacter sp. 5_MG-2023]MDP2505110.1 ABC transporter substrate-binding protein [Oceanobacter sp. 3_MG-2023]MDP2548234.1 ABC transporter substrate-binding protein [Oceanobacter sp. 4_MG-2023]MDP2608156.1 ABC transporter substrate-binding protein [Oceanobacter sp. 1_MG-2023]MDP2611182.1 ABC transporter substrate-binding protein [Oceanobacter sp. 2_MG-20
MKRNTNTPKAGFKLALHCSVAALMSVAALSAQAATGLSDNKVKIGVLADMSGTYGDLCGRHCVDAVNMAVEDFGGSVLGKPIEVVSADDQNKPDLGSAKAREWIESEGVDAINGLVASSVVGAVAQVANVNEKPILISGAGSNTFTTKTCSPFNAHWTYDVVALARGTVKPLMDSGKKKWFFITADYAFGHALEGVATGIIESNGGTVVGSARAPLGTTDYSSFVLQAMSSGADVVALANAGKDFVNSLKGAAEFGLNQQATMVGLLVFASDTKAIDADIIGDMRLTTGFYWDRDDASRAWAKRFVDRTGAIPTMAHAGAYSSTLHYLKAIKATGTDDGKAVMAQMKAEKPDDMFARNAALRADGRMVYDMYQVRVKKGSERSNPNDLYEIEHVIPGDQAFGAMKPECNFK